LRGLIIARQLYVSSHYADDHSFIPRFPLSPLWPMIKPKPCCVFPRNLAIGEGEAGPSLL
jgi:hypothetical protein